MPRAVDLDIEDARLSADPDSVEALFHFLDAAFLPWSVPPGDLALRFVTPETCSALHDQFFDDPEVTDVMTFPGDPEDEHAGDLAICPAYAAEAAPQHGTDFPTELTLYLVHGWLHLAGFTDQDSAATEKMRAAEATILSRLHAEGRFPDFSWNP